MTSGRLLAAILLLIVALAPLRGHADDLRSPAGEKIRDVFIVPDALGSPAALLNEAGEVIWRQGYSPYGERLNDPNEPEGTNTFDYTGHQVDQSGLVYTGARYYDPEIGRFLSMDPAGFDSSNVQSFNRYAYANNNPYRYVDPDGEVPFLVPVLIFVGKEAAGEVFEQVTGVPAPTMKNLGKAAVKQGIKKSAKARPRSSTRASRPNGVGKGPNRIYSARELKRRTENPRNNNSANPNHNFPESFNAEIFNGKKTIVSETYHLYTKPGTLNGRLGTFEIGVRPSASGRTEVITHRFFRPDKK